MFNCPNCNAKLKDGTEFCTKCGNKISGTENGKELTKHSESEKECKSNKNERSSKPNRFFYFLAVLVLIVSFYVTYVIYISGAEIMYISSVGGRTLEEAYYHSVGKIYKGIAFMCSVIGIFLSAVLVKFAKR